MRSYNVAVLGATGAVGQQMLQCLAEQDFPVGNLKLLASSRSAGKIMQFKGEDVVIEEARDEAFDGVDIVLGAAENNIAERFVPVAREKGAVTVDNSSAYRLDPDVPLVIPEVNPEDAAKHNGIIANPNCATIIGLVAVNPLHKLGGIKRMVVSTYQAASGAGVGGLRELESQMARIAAGEPVEDPKAFAYQLACNLIPQIGGFDEAGYTSEEMKMQNEGRKILHAADLRVNCTCVRVPVMRSHSESITLEFEREVSVEAAREALAAAPGVKLVDDPSALAYPMPLDTTDQDDIFVGRVREDISAAPGQHGLTLWCCGDQIRKGAATNAVQIAKMLAE